MLSKTQYKRHSLIFIRNTMFIESNKTEKLQNALKQVTLLHKFAVAQVQVPTHKFLKDKQEARRNRYTMPVVLLPVGSLPSCCSPPPVLQCVSKPPGTGRNELTWGTNSKENTKLHENRRAELTWTACIRCDWMTEGCVAWMTAWPWTVWLGDNCSRNRYCWRSFSSTWSRYRNQQRIQSWCVSDTSEDFSKGS